MVIVIVRHSHHQLGHYHLKNRSIGPAICSLETGPLAHQPLLPTNAGTTHSFPLDIGNRQDPARKMASLFPA